LAFIKVRHNISYEKESRIENNLLPSPAPWPGNTIKEDKTDFPHIGNGLEHLLTVPMQEQQPL
jgi:hypothetical protein